MRDYARALRKFLGGGQEEAALQAAYTLGRRALETGLGIPDLIAAHQNALADHSRKPKAAGVTAGDAAHAIGFLAESLSPFEMVQRGFRETLSRLQVLNETLEEEIERRTHALRESEERYRTLVDITPDNITLTDLDGKVALCNLQAAHMLGYLTPEEMIGREAIEFVAPEDRERAQAIGAEVAQTGIVRNAEYTFLKKDGTRFPVEINLSLMRDPSGAPSAFIAVVRDITERKQAEAEKARLRAETEIQRERLNTLVRHVPGVVWEAWGKPDAASQRIDFVSDYVETMMGYSVEEWLSTPNFWLTLVHPDDKEQAARISAKLFESGKPGVNQFRWVARDGRIVWVDAYSVVIRDEDGRPAGMRGVTLDITDRKLAETRLGQQARQRAAVAEVGQRALAGAGLQSLFDDAVRLVARTIDVEFCELLELLPDASALRLRGGAGWEKGLIGTATVPAGEESLAGYTLHSEAPVMVEDLAAETRFQPPQLLVDHNVVSGMTVIIHGKDQPYGVLGVHSSRRRRFTDDERDFLQSISNMLALGIDNIRLIQTEAWARREAERANEIKLKFLAMVSHELRTPLTSIKGFATTLLAEDIAWDAASQRDFIETINEEADKLAELIEQLLDLSRLEAGTLRIKPSSQHLAEMVEGIAARLLALAERHALMVDVPPDLPPVYADPDRVGQVISNLVDNAIKYAPPDTHIRIAACLEGDAVRIDVSDQGPGIPVEERERVFEVFHRGKDEVSSKSKGVGLGLAICQGLIEAQGGRIWIAERAAPGTTVCFTLPVVAEAVLQNR